jgi:hypothetical protein
MASETFLELVRSLVEKYGSVSNEELAMKQVKEIKGVAVEEGEVAEVEDEDAFEKYVKDLEGKIGPVATRFARQAVDDTEVPEEDLEKIPDKYRR